MWVVSVHDRSYSREGATAQRSVQRPLPKCRCVGKSLGHQLTTNADEMEFTTIPPGRKVQIFNAAVVSGLLYGLSSMWLNTQQQRQLDGIQARCLRNLLRIPHPWISRVSNKAALERAKQQPLTTQLRVQQLLLLGRVARAPDTDLRRRLTLRPGSLRLAADAFVRKQGRPRLEWAGQLIRVGRGMWPHGRFE